MSDSEESAFGALFFNDEADQAPPEYPVETLLVDRVSNLSEGTTTEGFVPLYHCFDSLTGTLDGDAAADHNSGHGADEERMADVRGQLLKLCERLTRVRPPPLAVHYRNKHHSLWGHRLWNAAKYLSKRMDQRCIDVRGKTVLELGAGLGVPSLVAYRNGAKLVVVTDYPDADLLEILQQNIAENCKEEYIDADVRCERSEGTLGSLAVVEPLLWGKEEHVEQVLRHTRNVGYDIVILSDILFNHVCNDDLVDTLLRTLSKSPSAAGYCVFSHHRAYKQLQDFEFFDKCTARGLVSQQVDEEVYPLMFPEDRGPEEVRMPVKCYKITRRYDRVGEPLDLTSVFASYARMPARKGGKAERRKDERCFDAVIQGTGVVQSLLSAALARSGLKVLHCDRESLYGGAHATLSVDQLVAYLKRAERHRGDEEEGCEAHLYTRPRVPGTEKPHILIDMISSSSSSGGSSVKERYAIDLLPASFMANGELLQQLVKSDMTRTLELRYLGGFVFLDDAGGDGCGYRLAPVPLTRSDVFSTTAISLLEKRRVMRLVKDVAPSLVEQTHAKTASAADRAEMQEAAAEAAAAEAISVFAREAEARPDLTLSKLLETKYGLSDRGLRLVTLMGQLDHRPRPSGNDGTDGKGGLVRSVQLVRQLLTSIGTFGSRLPFLLPAYGASELPQSACRIAAVWGAVFVLQRGLARIVVDEERDVQYAVLTNGQHIPAKVIVVPEELTRKVPGPSTEEGRMPLPVRHMDWQKVLEVERRRADGSLREGLTRADLAALSTDDTQFSRVVVIATKPLITARSIRVAEGKATAEGEGEGEDEEGEEEAEEPPTVLALTRADAASPSSPVVHVVQQSSASEQVSPRGARHVILHFTADAAELPQDALEQLVSRRFLCAPSATAPRAAAGPLNPDTDVVFFASFTLSGLQVALDSVYGDDDASPLPFLVDIPSATRASHAFAISECEKLQKATENDRRRMRNADAKRDRGSADSAAVGASASEEGEGEGEGEGATQIGEEEGTRPLPRLVGVPTFASHSLLDDGQYMSAAKAAYERVVEAVAGGPEGITDAELREAFVFLEKQPPLPQPTTD